jgi:hypothetical protein
MCFLAILFNGVSAQSVSIYPLPPLSYPFSGSDAYTLTVEGQNCPIYVVEEAVSASFSFSEIVTLRVKPKEGFSSYKIQPEQYNIQSQRIGDEILITLDDHTKSKFSIQFDNADNRNLFILADPPETDIPSPNDPNVLYVKAGVNYTHSSGQYSLSSNKTLYLEPGAVFYGRINVSGDNIKILGRGFIVDQNNYSGAVNNYNGVTNLKMNGVHLANGAKWTNSFHNVVGLDVDNIKLLYKGNETDAISFNYGTRNVSFKNTFIYNGDNVFVLESADTRDILVDNIVIYMNGGGHIVYPQGFGGGGTDLGGNIVLQNLYIIHPANNSKLYTTYWSPSTAIGSIESVHIENVWIDGVMDFIYLDVVPDGIRNTSFKNIHFSEIPGGLLKANGYNFTFEDIYYGGAKIESVSELNIQNNGNNTLTMVTTGPVAVIGVSINPARDSIPLGATRTLTAQFTPGNATNRLVSWSSNDPSIAIVNSSGVVTGIATGTTSISVTTEDGNKTSACIISVYIPAPSIIQNGTILEAESAILSAGNGIKPSGLVAFNDVGDYFYFPEWSIDGNINSVSVTYGVPSPYDGNIVEFRLGSVTGELLGSLTLQSTASWETMRTDQVDLMPWSGAQDLYVVFKQGSGTNTWVGDIDNLTFAERPSYLRTNQMRSIFVPKPLIQFDLLGRTINKF